MAISNYFIFANKIINPELTLFVPAAFIPIKFTFLSANKVNELPACSKIAANGNRVVPIYHPAKYAQKLDR